MQAHHQSLIHPDHSEPLNHQHIPPHDSVYAPQNNMYTSSVPDGLHSIHPDYVVDHEARKFQQQQQQKLDGLNNNFRTNAFSQFSATRTRNQSSRTGPSTSSAFRDPSYIPTSAADVYSPPLTSPTQSHLQPFDSRASYDFGAKVNMNGLGPKSYMDIYPSTVLPSHQTNGAKPHPQSQHTAYSYSSGPHLSSQTPYGPHLPTNANSSTINGASAGSNASAPPGLPISSSTINASNSSASTEEISTIFVVGFPEDMQEREFQNMFTFSPDFEAATLKIPNKEYTSYGGASTTNSSSLRNGYSNYGGPNDPYNLVTVNQGGVVVDGGRDGTMTSWPANVPLEDVNGVPFLSGTLPGNAGPGMSMPPRKQIIGFAKFKTRDAALQARDGLQGRRVDIDKGAVLKAEMAKKNLHTKRGVGPVTSAAVGGSSGGTGAQAGVHNTTGLQHAPVNGAVLGPESYMSGSEALSARELGALGTIGLGNGRLGQWGDQAQQQHDHIHSNGLVGEEDDRRGIISSMGLGAFGTTTRGARERAEDDERERRRKDKSMMQLRAGNTLAYDAFHSVPPGPVPIAQSSRQLNQSGSVILSPVDSEIRGSSNGFITARAAQQQAEELPGPWDNVRSRSITRPRSSSQHSTSPPPQPNGMDMPPRSFTPPDHQQFFEQSRHDPQYIATRGNHASSESSSSSVVGVPHSVGHSAAGSDGHAADAELSRALGGLDVSGDGGKTSPQLPSPASGASSKNGVDQNPPINTLYVGNLPTSPPPNGFPQDYLEESLRELFSSRAGFRRLCFRHKSNGPMCFVEFEDVPYATKALNDLYGNTLKGLVKGGIRLSYSKNPLGVRTPTSAGNNVASLQHQQQHPNGHHNVGIHAYAPATGQEFQPRNEEQSRTVPMILRRDLPIPSQPPSAVHQSYPPDLLATSPPPPRFFSSSPSGFSASASTPLSGASNTFIPRYTFGIPPTVSHAQPTTTFSPFGLSTTPPPSHSTIPEPINSDNHLSSSHSQHFSNNFAPTSNIEATRAG